MAGAAVRPTRPSRHGFNLPYAPLAPSRARTNAGKRRMSSSETTMNKERRKRISALDTATLKAKAEELKGLVDSMREEIEGIRDEEQEYYDAMPENMQDAERGEMAQEAIDTMETMIEALDADPLDSLVSAIDDFDGASF